MQRYIAVAALVLLILLVAGRVLLLKSKGIAAFKFGALDKKDFLLPPFALLYIYIVLAGAFGWPTPGHALFDSTATAWAGVGLCALGLVCFLLSLIAFGKSFRVGIDEDRPGTLVTSGIFAISRNPIYVSFILVFSGIFLILANWVLLLYVAAVTALIHRQVLREEASLKKIYSAAYADYCRKTRRYI
jgi:protein-S-isoprenylcysteine O-methyltransferase Ste14